MRRPTYIAKPAHKKIVSYMMSSQVPVENNYVAAASIAFTFSVVKPEQK